MISDNYGLLDIDNAQRDIFSQVFHPVDGGQTAKLSNSESFCSALSVGAMWTPFNITRWRWST